MTLAGCCDPPEVGLDLWFSFLEMNLLGSVPDREHDLCDHLRFVTNHPTLFQTTIHACG